MPRLVPRFRRPLLVVALSVLVACSGGKERQAQYLARAQEHFAAGNFDKAMVEARNVLQINTNNVEGRFLLAQLHEHEQNWQQMYANLKLVIDLEPGHVPARIKFGQMLYSNGMYDEAIAQADAVLALQPQNADALTLRGSVFYRQGRAADAEQQAELALQYDPQNVGAISVLSAVWGDKDPERALGVIGDGIAKQTKNATLKLLKIRVLEQSRREDETVAVYRELIADHPDNLFYHYRLVRYLEEHQRTDEAEALLRDIVNTRPDNLELKLWLAQFLANNRNPDLAESTLKGFIAQQPRLYDLQFALGKLYTATRRIDEARTTYAGIVTLDGEGADALLARNRLVELALAAGNHVEANALLRAIFAIEPENSEGLITRARMALMSRDTRTATADLRTVLRNEPTNVTALRLLAGAHESDGALNLALDNYRQLLEIAPTDHDAAYQAARLALAQGEVDGAQQALVALTEADPSHLDAQRLLIASYGKQQQWEAADARVKALIATESTRAMGLYLRGRIEFDRKQLAEAARTMTDALALEPGIIEALNYLVSVREELGQHADALAYVRGHIAAHPEHAHAFDLLARLLAQDKDVGGATAAWRKSLELAPWRVETYTGLSSLLLAQGDADGALAVLRDGVKHNPRSAEMQVVLAEFMLQRNDVAAAMAGYTEALKLQPSLAVAANNLAALIADQSDSDEARLRQALELVQPLEGSQQPAVLDTLAWINYRLGNSSRSVTLLETALQLGGTAPIFHYHLGMAYHSQQQAALAREHLSLAVADEKARYPGREEAQRTLNSL